MKSDKLGVCVIGAGRGGMIHAVNFAKGIKNARLTAIGDITLTKMDHTFSKLMSFKGQLVDYVQYPGSDCRNGAVLKIRDGHRAPQIANLARVFDLEFEEF